MPDNPSAVFVTPDSLQGYWDGLVQTLSHPVETITDALYAANKGVPPPSVFADLYTTGAAEIDQASGGNSDAATAAKSQLAENIGSVQSQAQKSAGISLVGWVEIALAAIIVYYVVSITARGRMAFDG